jgi:hypothetical protein
MNSQKKSLKHQKHAFLELYQTPTIRWSATMKAEAVSYLKTIRLFQKLEELGIDLNTMVSQAKNIHVLKN